MELSKTQIPLIKTYQTRRGKLSCKNTHNSSNKELIDKNKQTKASVHLKQIFFLFALDF